MNVKIADLMAKRVITVQRHHNVERVRGIMERNRFHAVPVVGAEGEALGIVTSADLARRVKGESPVTRVMTKNVLCVPAYNDVSVAARIMRKHKIHHVVVTQEKKVVGMISSFDLMKLLEGKRFTMKNAPKSAGKAKRKAR
jgi:CBS domain-containing protein